MLLVSEPGIWLAFLATRKLGGWTRWPTEVPSNPYYSVILWSVALMLIIYCRLLLLLNLSSSTQPS